MTKTLIICIESNKKARTEQYYINDVIKHFYNLRASNVNIQWVYMESKTAYKTPSVSKKIDGIKKQITDAYKRTRKTSKKKFLDTEIESLISVIYCFDSDDFNNAAYHKSTDQDIKRNFSANQVVWFNDDVEDVFWDTTVSNSEKSDKAQAFSASRKIECISERKLTCANYKKHYSNLLIILDQFLIRKENNRN